MTDTSSRSPARARHVRWTWGPVAIVLAFAVAFELGIQRETESALDAARAGFRRLRIALATLAARLAKAPVHAYRWTLKPLIGWECRHLPTCSEYCKECIARHGLWAGGWMGLARLCRCHPCGTSGFDPAPEAKPQVSAFTPWKYGAWSWKRLPDACASAPADQCKNGVSHGVR